LIVLDTSAAVDVLVANQPAAGWVADQLEQSAEIAVPHLIDVEVASALRRLAHTEIVSERRARSALSLFAELDVKRYPHLDLIPRVWQLRAAFTAYDAVFVALAEALDAELVTTDAALGRAPGARCRIRAFSR
jgi:predicted nucleic acid-binding protein